MKILLENISKKFEQHVALHQLNLEVNSGELVALLGPSGCGKSTTLMMLAGLYKPSTGNIWFGDRVVNDVEPKDRNIGMVFQSYALYPHMTVLENIAFPLKQQKVSKVERVKRAKEVAELVRLEGLLDRKPSQLSGGQQQRVAMARALVKKPDLLLLDEPMSNLDARLKIEMRDEIRRLQKKLKITTILVTHDQEEAMAMADHIAILDQGEIQQYDTPDNLFTEPKNLFVAHFMGNPPMNFLEGELVSGQGTTWFEGNGYRIEIPKEASNFDYKENQKVKLGVRPHQYFLTDQKQGAIPADVLLVEHLGREAMIQAEVNGATIRIFIENQEIQNLPEQIFLKPEPQGIHLFDQLTGENLVRKETVIHPETIGIG
jgi:ABC-type sugar transport system ATPase subunit